MLTTNIILLLILLLLLYQLYNSYNNRNSCWERYRYPQPYLTSTLPYIPSDQQITYDEGSAYLNDPMLMNSGRIPQAESVAQTGGLYQQLMNFP